MLRFLFLLILLIAFGVRMWHLNTEPIWHDEGWSIRAIRGPFTTPDDNTPFVYYLTGHVLWRAGAGESPLALRYVSVLLGVLTAAVTLRIGWRWFGAGAALGAGVLVAVSPLLWEYAQEVRAYAAVPLLALLLLALVAAILRREPGESVPRRLWMALAMAELAALYTHNLGVPLVAWLNIALGMVWLVRREWWRMVVWAGLQVVVLLAYVPWILTQSPSGTPLNTPPEPGLGLVGDVWVAYFLPALRQFEDAAGGWLSIQVLGLALVALTLVAGAMAVWHPRHLDRARVWLLISHALLVPALSTALMLAANIDFHPRYYIAAVPGTMLLAAAGAAALRPYRLGALVLAAFTLGGAGVSIASLHQITTTRGYQHDDFAGLAAYYATLPAEAVILLPFDDEPALQVYYADRYDIHAEFVNVPLYSDEAEALATINQIAADGPRHVELLTWFQLPADTRGMYPCLLTAAHVGEALDEPHFYFGLATQSFQVGPLDWIPLDAGPRYREVNLTGAAYVESAAGLCLRTGWRLAQPTGEDWQLAAALLDPLGGELARDNSPITRPDNVGTRRWKHGDEGQAYMLLNLPAGAPRRDYTLTWNVFGMTQPSGIDVLDAAGNPAGRTYRLADAVVAEGPPFDAPPLVPELIASNADAGSIPAGLPLDLTLALPAFDTPLPVSLRGEGWELERELVPAVDGASRLAWLRFVVPPEGAGAAVLQIEGETLARFDVIAVPRTFDEPPFAEAVGAEFPGVGVLVGASVESGRVTPEAPAQVSLVWRAESTPAVDYTVFVQLIGEDGRVIAQSDSVPADGLRPTSGWADGEYIIDGHTLGFNVDDFSGAATLIAGLYNANRPGFPRQRTVDGLDAVSLPLVVTVGE